MEPIKVGDRVEFEWKFDDGSSRQQRGYVRAIHGGRVLVGYDCPEYKPRNPIHGESYTILRPDQCLVIDK